MDRVRGYDYYYYDDGRGRGYDYVYEDTDKKVPPCKSALGSPPPPSGVVAEYSTFGSESSISRYHAESVVPVPLHTPAGPLTPCEVAEGASVKNTPNENSSTVAVLSGVPVTGEHLEGRVAAPSHIAGEPP